MAALLAVGADAVLSHRTAATLHGIRVGGTAIDVTTLRQRRPRSGIRIHLARLRPDEHTTRDGIPTTTAARTLLDLAATLSPHRLERAMNEADRLRLAGTVSLTELLERHPGRPGTPALRAILEDARRGEDITRSELEDRFLELVDQAGLPTPRTNTLIEGFEVDCAWPEHRLIVELDGHAFHATRAAYERDRERDRALQAKGWCVVRITWRQLHESPADVVADLIALLGR
jgi:very-short-patch-repair endonuclease